MSTPAVGVEEGFLLAAPAGSTVRPAGGDVVDGSTRRDPDGQYEVELKRAQVEHGTDPAGPLPDLLADLARRRQVLVAEATERGARLIASGTWPASAARSGADPADATPHDRYAQMHERYGEIARQQLVCAMHVHVQVPDDDAGVTVIDRLAPYLPVLTALAANSPWHDGRDTGHASWRRVLWTQWPSAGPTAAFGDLAAYRATEQALVTSGAARDRAMIYFDARLSARFPTVEFRVCDVQTDARHAVAVAGLLRGLVVLALRDALPPSPVLRAELLAAASWRAARYGMTDRLVDPTADGGRLVEAWTLLERLLGTVSPVLSDLDRLLVKDGVTALRQSGTGAHRQRAARSVSATLDAVTVSRL